MGNSHEYYLARLAKEREMARAAFDPAIARIHRELADHYERLAAQIQGSEATSASI